MMIAFRHVAIGLLIGLVPAGPALAADNLACIANGLSDAQRAGIVADVEADRDLDDAVISTIAVCAVRHRWSEDARMHAIVHTIASAMRSGMMRRAPISPAQVIRAQAAYDGAFSEAEARAIVRDGMSEAQGRRMEAAFAAAGLPGDAEIVAWLGGYMAASQMEKYSRIDFAAA